MMRVEMKQLLTVAAVVLVVLLVVQCWGPISDFLLAFWGGCIPIVIGFGFAFAGNILLSFIERHFAPNSTNPRVVAMRRPVSLVLTILLVVLAILGFIAIVIPQFASAIVLLQQNIPSYVEALKGQLGGDLLNSIQNLLAPGGADAAGGNASDPYAGSAELLQNAGGLIGDVANSVVSFATSAASVLMSALLSIALLAEKETFQRLGLRCLHTYASDSFAAKVMHTLRVFNSTFRGFLVKQFADALIIGLLIMAFMMLAGLPYAAAVAALVGVSALVPMIGVFIGLALGAFLVFAVSPISAVIFAVVGFAIVQIEASFISPRITEQALGIPGIWVLVAITVFGAVWGILGILVGVPTFAALYRLLVQDLDRREARKAAEEDREERVKLASEEERELSAGETVS